MEMTCSFPQSMYEKYEKPMQLWEFMLVSVYFQWQSKSLMFCSIGLWLLVSESASFCLFGDSWIGSPGLERFIDVFSLELCKILLSLLNFGKQAISQHQQVLLDGRSSDRLEAYFSHVWWPMKAVMAIFNWVKSTTCSVQSIPEYIFPKDRLWAG